jgi:DNA-binding NtrC family response regulator
MTMSMMTASAGDEHDDHESVRASAHKGSLLLAEDDPDMRWLLSMSLRKEGYEVIEVRDGAELRAKVRTQVANPKQEPQVSMIISDFRMPGATGLDVLEELRRLEQSMPFILITAFGDEATHEAARRLGAVVFDKPLDLEDLRTAVLYLASRSERDPARVPRPPR